MARAALVSAALRHIRDAEHLLAPGDHRSIEQALHLAGFAPECARKGCIDDAIADQALGHDIESVTDSIVEMVVALDPAATRYGFDQHAAMLPCRAQHWTPSCRYMATGPVEPLAAVAGELVQEARAFVDDLVLRLWSDGNLPSGVLRLPER